MSLGSLRALEALPQCRAPHIRSVPTLWRAQALRRDLRSAPRRLASMNPSETRPSLRVRAAESAPESVRCVVFAAAGCPSRDVAYSRRASLSLRNPTPAKPASSTARSPQRRGPPPHRHGGRAGRGAARPHVCARGGQHGRQSDRPGPLRPRSRGGGREATGEETNRLRAMCCIHLTPIQSTMRISPHLDLSRIRQM